jgi:GTP-binding protein
MNFFAAGGEDGFGSPGKLAVLDMPGYGKGSREERGPDINKYLSGRRQYVIQTPVPEMCKETKELQVVKRAFPLVNALHGLILFPKGKSSVDLIERHSPDLHRICDELKTKIQPGERDGLEGLSEIVTSTS